MRYHACQYPDKTDNFVLLGPNLPRNGVWGRNFEILSLYSESAPPRYHVNQFSVKMDNFEFFGLNLGKLSNYVWYLVRILLRLLQRAGWRWMEPGAWFCNTHCAFNIHINMLTIIWSHYISLLRYVLHLYAVENNSSNKYWNH